MLAFDLIAQESLVNIKPIHTVSETTGEYKYEVGSISVVGILILSRYSPKTTNY